MDPAAIKRNILICSLSLLVTSGCGETQAPSVSSLVEAHPINLDSANFVETELGVELSQPRDIVWDSEGLIIVDGANDRLVFVKRDATIVMGHPGSGPGELRAPGAVSVTDGVAYVSDGGNQRVARYRLADGASLGSIPVLGITTERPVVVPGRQPIIPGFGSRFLKFLDGTPVPLLDPGSPFVSDSILGVYNRVVRIDSTVYFLDNTRGVIHHWTPGTGDTGTITLPHELLAPAAELRELRPWPNPSLFKDLTVTDDGKLFIFAPMDTIVGAVINPLDNYFHIVLMHPSSGSLNRSRSAVLTSEALYAVGLSGLLKATVQLP